MKQLQSEYQCAINLVIDLIGGKGTWTCKADGF